MTAQIADPFNLQRFVHAQAQLFDQVIAELRAGRKRSHWMWFIFPQIAGLGASSMAERYAISGSKEAMEYLHHQLLGPRLKLCTQLLLQIENYTLEEILGFPDNLKFHSSVTLFASVAPDEKIFQAALNKYFAGQPDHKTLDRL